MITMTMIMRLLLFMRLHQFSLLLTFDTSALDDPIHLLQVVVSVVVVIVVNVLSVN